MKKNSKNQSVKSQLPQQQATLLSSLTMDELESVQGGYVEEEDENVFRFRFFTAASCRGCSLDGNIFDDGF